MTNKIYRSYLGISGEYKPAGCRNGFYALYIKRSMDFILSLLALVLLSPVLLIVAILIRVNLGSPVIFKQQRPGKDGKIFSLYKFRSMTEEKDENGELLPDEMRLTKFGKLLRSTSLDELPEFINILKGDMAIVGPRPLLVEYLPVYNEHQKRRHEVRPGLTGLAQVKGRNRVKWDERFNLDVQYVERLSFWYDFKLIIMTLPEVLKHNGISCGTSATMEVFRSCGSKG